MEPPADDPSTQLIGQQLGDYDVYALLGVGGMGEVYRARDVRLGRDVALKMLPSEFANDADRVMRFQREARVLAALNHPNIAAIYGVHHDDQHRALVLEFVEGETLADCLQRGPLPLDQTLLIATQIAAALESAHDKGIVHRDLKPGNIKITPNGLVKVLDFGLAKAVTGDSGPHVSQTPTVTATESHPGFILGTAAYMSPEQARGLAIDQQTDVWAFGCVLYEMLTARRLWAGATVSDTIAAILEREPDWALLPADTPSAVRRLLHRCLRKEPRQRLHHFGDVRLDLIHEAGVPAEQVRGTPAQWLMPTASAIAVIATIAALWSTFRSSEGRREHPGKFTVPAPSGLSFREISVSPDGRRIALVTWDQARRSQLWLRHIDDLQLMLIPSSGAYPRAPFWSPDGNELAFFTENQLLRIRPGDAQPTFVANVLTHYDASYPSGSWGSDGTILYSDDDGVIRSVSANGGSPRELLPHDKSIQHLWPSFLSDGQRFLFVTRKSNPQSLYSVSNEPLSLHLGDLHSQETARVGEIGSRFALLRDGRVLYRDGLNLVVRTLAPSATRFSGTVTTIVSGVARNYLAFGGTDNTLAFLTPSLSHLLWVDRAGRAIAPITDPGEDATPALSPDETRLALTRVDPKTRESYIRTIDLATRQLIDSAIGPGSRAPVWSPDGLVLAFQRGDRISYKAASGVAKEEQLASASGRSIRPCAWTADQHAILYHDSYFGSLDVASLAGEPVGFSKRASISCAAISPDNRSIVYAAGDGGLRIADFPRLTNDRLLLELKGNAPRSAFKASELGRFSSPKWRRDGGELYFINMDTAALMTVPIDSSGSLGTPSRLFNMAGITVLAEGISFSDPLKGLLLINPDFYDYAPSGDGQRFIVRRYVDPLSVGSATVVTNWEALTK